MYCALIVILVFRVPTSSGKSWFFFLKIPGLGTSWKNILEITHFFVGSHRSQFFCSLRLQINCSLLPSNLWCQYIIFKRFLATKKSWKIFRGGFGKFWKNLDFFVSKRVGTLGFLPGISGEMWIAVLLIICSMRCTAKRNPAV